MATRDMASWETAIAKVVMRGDTERSSTLGIAERSPRAAASPSMMYHMDARRFPTKPQHDCSTRCSSPRSTGNCAAAMNAR